MHAPDCPLCGRPNECAASRCGSFSEPCWCESVRISRETLARIPEGLRGAACICRACAIDRNAAYKPR
ncbi:MAG: cysteine-rich CWC family protein [Proteobacteria bacterium]|nr:cysteine-rich CWC family protein [Pseudomonadota bacterium]